MDDEIPPTNPQMLSVVIPAYNEEGGISGTIQELVAALEAEKYCYEIIIIDDGSTDGTAAQVAAQRQVRLLRHRKNKGYGAALKTGTLAAKGNIVIFYDADGQFDPQDIKRMVDELGQAEAALGARIAGSYNPLSRRWGKKLLGWLANYLAKTKIPDLNCGLRAIKRDILLSYLHLLPQGFSASTTTTLVLLKEGYDISFVPITVKKRIGRSTVRPIRDGMDTVLLLLRLTTLLDPFRIFSPASILLFLTGLLWGLHYLLRGHGLSTGSLFLMMTGVMIFFFGLLTDQVAALRRERRFIDRKL